MIFIPNHEKFLAMIDLNYSTSYKNSVHYKFISYKKSMQSQKYNNYPTNIQILCFKRDNTNPKEN